MKIIDVIKSALGSSLETWNDCVVCGKVWRDDIPTPGVLHRTVVCKECEKRDESHKNFSN